ncbi:hypothetical protein AVDCRST_MAG92-4968 [uncultured Coleofasciculus sp.]|uniref:Uncharacterized protein n=1 Tax=uncultured Coleofasciculus sp. TaxID=1267456 RepID=A0A6J4K946_9CYAN|nr:hypothetical protein AVDCRST_MAG92-4968 [uncultured Coleofasciculus sp.]
MSRGMAQKHIKIKFPLWQFLNQPLFSPTTRLVLNPNLFATLYRIQLLERCLAKEYNSKGRRCN